MPELIQAVFNFSVEWLLRWPTYAKASVGILRCRIDLGLAIRSCAAAKDGGADRDRTDDLMLAKHALSQLSYGPVVWVEIGRR